jgi:aconitate hydratase
VVNGPARTRRAPRNVAQKLIAAHLVDGEMTPGAEIGLRIDQTLTQDATGTLVMLELEAMGLDRVKTELSAQYVDHNLLQLDHKNPDDHEYLRTACARFGVWYSRPGNGVSHPVHMQAFGRPGKSLAGSDSHTPAAGSLGMLAFGAGGIEVALAMAGEPLYVKMPEIWGVRLEGDLPDWVSAKDVILELLRRHGVAGAVGRIIEYHGPGLAGLGAMDRHVLANMGTELGATTTVFPSDEEIRRFLESEGRGDDWTEIRADDGARYDVDELIELDRLEPLIAKPCSPGNVVLVEELVGTEVSQAYLGSSANPGYRDFAVPALMVEGRTVADHVSFDINPTSRRVLEMLDRDGHLGRLLRAGARLHQAGCNGCIGMGQAPASGQNSLRTVPRNFPGRSGTLDDSVFLCSPETATASALMGRITDPRELKMSCPRVGTPVRLPMSRSMLVRPRPRAATVEVEPRKGPNIVPLPSLEPLPDRLELRVLLKTNDDLSTDEILPAGSRILPYRSNIEKLGTYAFEGVDPHYPERAREAGDHAVVGGVNYGQGSSREHAALVPRSLGLRLVIAKSFARIHWQNLVNFGVLPLRLNSPDDYDRLEPGDRLLIEGLLETLARDREVEVDVNGNGTTLRLAHDLSRRQLDVLRAGGVVNWVAGQHKQSTS